MDIEICCLQIYFSRIFLMHFLVSIIVDTKVSSSVDKSSTLGGGGICCDH